MRVSSYYNESKYVRFYRYPERIIRTNESLGKLNTGSSEFREIVKVLLRQGTKTSVTPNSNIVNFTIDDIRRLVTLETLHQREGF